MTVEQRLLPCPSQTVGPFFHNALMYPGSARVAGSERRDVVQLFGRVLDGAGHPLPDAMVEIWQADEDGHFVEDADIFADVSPTGFRGFGRTATDADGRFLFDTIKPGPIPTTTGRPQAPHVAMSIFARVLLRQCVTRVYFADEPAANTLDPLLVGLSAARRATLIAAPAAGGYLFDVHVQGDRETVFLDVWH